MSTAQRVSRGLRRMGIFIAAALLISMSAWTLTVAVGQANVASEKHAKLLCAHKYFEPGQEPKNWILFKAAGLNAPIANGIPDDLELSLKTLNCSDVEYETVSYADARDPPSFNWVGVFGRVAAIGVGIALAVSLAIHSIIRAIGWVIGGFAAS